MTCSPISELERFATALAQGAALELYLTPKPGLVDLADRGAHPDLSLAVMERSLQIVAAYLDEIARSLGAGEPFIDQKQIALQTERRLLATLGTNTHKGYVFLAGMLLIARRHAASPEESAIRRALSCLAGDFFRAGEETASNGRRARDKYAAGGIVQEAVEGYPSVFEAALPAFRQSMQTGGCFNEASFAMLARLMQTVDDTTTLHRAGPSGLVRIRRDGRQLEQLIARRDDYIGFLRETNRAYIAMNLTMGGVADMLGISYACLIACGDISEASLDDFRLGKPAIANSAPS
jgi:triphosphoribosyl-dephospho-CoA synthase